MEIISVENLTKKYGKKVALRNVSVKISKGEIVGLVGPNGAGKTTFIKCITGLLNPEEGNIKLFGYDLSKNYGTVIKKVGLLLEAVFYDYLTAYENLRILYILNGKYDHERIQEIMEFVGLWDVRNKYVSTFSYGMKQRLGLAQALMTSPELIILDEPTVGLDPIGIKELKEKLIYLSKNKGVTIFFSSHHLEDVEEVCDRVILLREGSVAYDGAVKDVVKRKEYHIILSKHLNENIFVGENSSNSIELKDNIVIVKRQEELNNTLKMLYIHGIDVLDIDIKTGSLFNLFYREGDEE